ncbi:MAG: 16S rRNA (guanine(966)-N(2))-methyltransferase RsmD [Rickettsiaceae bacterium]|nr:16S rRNA (guanine(966)-N(2))-methyltransferase RsmD [Rickettsiaceae bacterium]
MRIISGRHKGRIIPSLAQEDYRPTTSKFREALFSILSSGEFGESDVIKDAKMLDLYAGTGSLSFEALSRGIRSVTLVDTNEKYLQIAREFAQKIKEEDKFFCIKCSAINLLYSNIKYDIVVMDPPYGKKLITKTLRSLVQNNWLSDNCIIAIESEPDEKFQLEDNMHILQKRKYGNSKLTIISYVKDQKTICM